MKKMADEIKVAIVTGLCIIGLAIFFKKEVSEEVNYLVKFSPLFLFLIYLFSRGKKSKSKYDKPLYWIIGIIIVTILNGLLVTF